MSNRSSIDELLSRLETKDDDDISYTIIIGRALSRSEKYLHVATPSGTLAIPIEDILSVSATDSDPLNIRLEVRHAERIRPLQAPRSSSSGQIQGRRLAIPGFPGQFGAINVLTYCPTAADTVTGGVNDMSDIVDDQLCDADGAGTFASLMF